MRQKSTLFYWIILIFLTLSLTQCSDLAGFVSTPTPPPPTDIPVESSVSQLNTSRDKLETGETTDIQVGLVQIVGADIPIEYEWRTTGGEIAQGQGTCCITYEAPDEPGIYEISLTVKYGDQIVERATELEVTAPPVTVVPTETPTPVVAAETPEPVEEALETAEDYFTRAQDRYTRRDIEGTIVDYDKAIELGYEPLYEPVYNRGYIYYVEREYGQAIEDFTRAIELNYEPLSLPYYNRGNAYYYLGQNEEAIEDYTKAIELGHEPLNWLHNSRGLAYRKVGEYQKAIDDYTQAIQLKHDPLSWPFYNRGNVFAEIQRYDLAIADYTEALKVDPSNAEAYYSRGLAYKALGDVSRAKVDFNEALALGDEYMRKEAEAQLQELEAE